ncbi:MAG: GNAT family N-acetyltransferase [Clostridiales bacterium]|nr:GNAT family N-acetyltransferase [Clostridiales bacterium]
MTIEIERMSLNNLEDIYNFEVENKTFFEKGLSPRPEGYFEFCSFKMMMLEILKEQSEGTCHMHLIRDSYGKMIGRINLHSITKGKVIEAELGYRIGENEQGKGYATEAIKLILEKAAAKYGITCIKAGTSTENIGSRKILEKNGFKWIGEEKKVMKVNGRWIDGLLFEKQL